MIAISSTFFVLGVVFGSLALFMGVATFRILGSDSPEIWGKAIKSRDIGDYENWMPTVGLALVSFLFFVAR